MGVRNFAWALSKLIEGMKVSRKCWSDYEWIVMMTGMKLPPYSSQTHAKKVNDRTAKLIGKNTPFNSLPYIASFSASKKWQPGWLPQAADLFADDWEIIEDESL